MAKSQSSISSIEVHQGSCSPRSCHPPPSSRASTPSAFGNDETTPPTSPRLSSNNGCIANTPPSTVSALNQPQNQTPTKNPKKLSEALARYLQDPAMSIPRVSFFGAGAEDSLNWVGEECEVEARGRERMRGILAGIELWI